MAMYWMDMEMQKPYIARMITQSDLPTLTFVGQKLVD